MYLYLNLTYFIFEYSMRPFNIKTALCEHIVYKNTVHRSSIMNGVNNLQVQPNPTSNLLSFYITPGQPNGDM